MYYILHYFYTTLDKTKKHGEAAGYKPPRWHGKKQHTTLPQGFASVRACYEHMLLEEKPLRAESRDLGLKQH